MLKINTFFNLLHVMPLAYLGIFFFHYMYRTQYFAIMPIKILAIENQDSRESVYFIGKNITFKIRKNVLLFTSDTSLKNLILSTGKKQCPKTSISISF